MTMETFKKSVNKSSWIVTIVAIITLLLTTYLVYGEAFHEIRKNQEEHVKYMRTDSLFNLQLKKVIRNQDMMYINLLRLAKKQGIKLESSEELFLNEK